jgi:hypothetical protein
MHYTLLNPGVIQYASYVDAACITALDFSNTSNIFDLMSLVFYCPQSIRSISSVTCITVEFRNNFESAAI